jgi:hypothetical protein
MSSNCSGSGETETTTRHLLKDGLIGPKGEQAASSRPKMILKIFHSPM